VVVEVPSVELKLEVVEVEVVSGAEVVEKVVEVEVVVVVVVPPIGRLQTKGRRWLHLASFQLPMYPYLL
jgi:hypothetical protein